MEEMNYDSNIEKVMNWFETPLSPRRSYVLSINLLSSELLSTETVEKVWETL